LSDSGNTGELITLALKRAGVSHLFTLNGGHIWPILTAAVEHEIRIIDVRHEQSAAFAAEGWAKVTRECGVAAVTAGPGVTNAVTALAQASSGDSPMFVIGGRAPVSRWGMGSLQEMDHVAVVKTLTKKALTLESPDDAYGVAAECIRTALSRRTGPVFMDVPIDVFFGAADIPEATEHLTPDPGPPPDPDRIAETARSIREAKHPVVVAGAGVWWAHAEAELRELVENGQLPLIVNGMARGTLPPDHPLHFSRARSKALREADVVVVVGARLDFRLNFGQPPVFGDETRIIHIDVDRAEITGALKPAVAGLASGMKGPMAGGPDWLEALTDAESAGRRKDQAMLESDSEPIHPARLIAEVARFADPDAIIVGDGGDFVSFAGRLIERPKPGLWIDPGPFGALGSGPAYAMAAQLAHRCRLSIEWVGADVYDAVAAVGGRRFDLVYTGVGALGWLPELPGWARTVAGLLRPGGALYLLELHPMWAALVDDGRTICQHAIDAEFTRWDDEGSYAAPEEVFDNNKGWERLHSIGDVVSAVLEAGLHLELFHEFDVTPSPTPWLERGHDGLYRFPAGMLRFPLCYSLRARRR